MQGKEFSGVKISGIACAVPDNKVYTDDYCDRFGSDAVSRFKNATGINGRYVSVGSQTASDLCYTAAKALMEKKGLTGEDFDALIFLTQSPDYCRPATSFVLHKRLNLRKDCLAFDVNLGCTAFIKGVYTAAALLESGAAERVLLLMGDANMLAEADENDTSFNMMFGDAGAAVILERGEGTIKSMIRSDGEGYKTMITPLPGYRFPGVYKSDDPALAKKMDGDDVFLFTITKVPKLFKEFYKFFNCSADDFDYVILHQANMMIINHIAKKLKLPLEKVPVSLGEYGNTDGASIPVSVVDVCKNMTENKKLRIISSGFGIGLSWGIIAFEIDSGDVLPMIFTNDYYEEGTKL